MPGLTALQFPSFLYGTLSSVQRKARKEGVRCAARYREHGSFPTPPDLVELPPGGVVVAHEVVDFERERPAWRLYLVSDVMSGIREALDWKDTRVVRDAYEDFFLAQAWGALYFALAQLGPVSAQRTALRLQAVVHCWEPLQSARYLFKHPVAAHTLEELMTASCDWAMDAWCPGTEGSPRERLAIAATRMARSTRQDCIEAILRELPRALAHAGTLKHRDTVADPSFQRERLSLLKPHSFERVSGANTGELIGQLRRWDRELGTS